MALVVQKYGGTSVGTVERIKHVAARIGRAHKAGDRLVVIVSAMGDTTDDLLKLVAQISSRPPLREVDQLLATGEEQTMSLVAIALHEQGTPAISLSGPQAGISTTGQYGKARISEIKPTRVQQALDSGKVVIIAGFQGLNQSDDITTLGRGGSDTTAVAIAAALKADRCEIMTDVEGIFTSDPRIVPAASKIDMISYEEMMELAWRGAKMHPRSIELAGLYKVPVMVASSFSDTPGTLITEVRLVETGKTISGVAYERGAAKITVANVPPGAETLATIFSPLAEHEVSVDVIVVSGSQDANGGKGLTSVSFTVGEKDLAAAEPMVKKSAAQLGGTVTTSTGFAKVSMVGTGMLNRPGYAATMFKTLAAAGVAIEMVTTSEIQVTCVIPSDKVEVAVRRLHTAFGLDRTASKTPTQIADGGQ